MTINLQEMGYLELEKFRVLLEERMEEFRPLRIREKYKRCGRKTCLCSEGPADNAWGNLHGPYLFAQFVDETGKMRNKSLGRYYNYEEREEIKSEGPVDWSDYFTIRSRPGEPGEESYTLSKPEFFSRFGCYPEDTSLDFPGTFWATEFMYNEYLIEIRLRTERIEAADSLWGVVFGLASLAGHAALSALLAENYYLVED